VLCEELNLVGEVDACAFMPLPCYLFAHIDSFSAFDAEHSKIPKDQ